ncbi:glycerate kinase family protein [Endothiovibrio diazotrophicus]
MKVLVASNGHKDLLTPAQACRAIAEGMVRSGVEVECAPMADGGDGLIEVMTAGVGGRVESVPAHDALFRPREARLGLLDDGATAVIEIAEAAGSAILAPHERQTMVATSFGVGELILAAVERGRRRIIVGLGGSIVTDCGMGMAQALGVEFLDRDGAPLAPLCNRGHNALSLMAVGGFRRDRLRVDPGALELVVAADVETVLLGEHGQAATFGPQKGADAVEIAYLDRGLSNLAAVIRRESGIEVDIPLAGAAGGLGAGLHGFLGAELRLGAELVAAELALERRIADADLLVVGEGRMDRTTLHNKGPYYLARIAQASGTPVVAVVGVAEERPALFRAIYPGPALGGGELTSAEAWRRLSRAAGEAIDEMREQA